jgi:glycerol-3-phosphate dehydrogenase
VDEGTKLFPDLPRMRILRAYAGVRPLYKPPAEQAVGGNRSITRAHAILDHADQGVDNFVSIVGGKLTTHRLMAEQTVDVVVEKMGITARCTTADEALPDQHEGKTYWLGHRLADIEAEGGGDADLLCECELVTRSMAEAYLDRHWPCTIDDVRRGTRVGMGPCQGAFCTFRVAGLITERLDDAAPEGSAEQRAIHAATADRALGAFLQERFKGTRPIAHGRQLQELLMTYGIYAGVLGLDSIAAPAEPAPSPATTPEAVDAAR